MRRGALALLALLALPPQARAQLPPPGDFNALDALYQCFRSGAQSITHDGYTVDFGPGTEAFFFEQLGAAMQAQGNDVQLAWCDPWFVAPYVKAHRALHGSTGEGGQGPAHSPHLPLSTGVHQGKEDRLIHLAARMGGVSHVSAHGDMVRHALSAPAVVKQLKRLGLGTCAKGLLMQGAQVPDLYLFLSPLWHAQSLSVGEAEQSRHAFIRLVVRAVHDAQAAVLAQDVEGAMVLLGAAAHAVQDLTYHRGMTQGQKAGLTYWAHSNPDLPPEPADQRLRMQATRSTSALLAASLAPLPRGIGALAMLTDHDHELALGTIQSLWPDACALNYDTLRRYFISHQGPQQTQELARANLGMWPYDATLNAVLAAL